MAKHGDARLTNLLLDLAQGEKARSLGVHNRCKAVYESLAIRRMTSDSSHPAHLAKAIDKSVIERVVITPESISPQSLSRNRPASTHRRVARKQM
jgi:hypothetical protein